MNAAVPRADRASVVLTWGLGLFLLFNAFAVNGALWLAAPPTHKETVLQHSWDVVRGRGCDDSWGIMAYALEYAQAPHTSPLYTEIFFNRKLKFQYPMTSLFTIGGMKWLVGPEHVRTDECQVFETPTINDYLGWLCILLTAAASAALLEMGLKKQGVRSSALMIAARAVIVLGLTLTFYPVAKAFTLGQIQLWITGMSAMALLCWAGRHKATSGVLVGLACLIKPHYGAFLLWGTLRREWRFTVACAAMVVIGLAASFAVFGWTDNVDYLRVFWFLSQRGETYYPNQSVNGLISRIMSLIDPASYNSIEFDSNSFPPFNIWIYGPVIVTSLIIVAAALFRRGSEGDSGRVVDFSTMALSITMASPIAWEHHYGHILPIFAVLLAGAIGSRTRLLWLAGSYVLISNFIPVANLLAHSVANLAQSYLFFAAIAVLIMLHRSRPGWQVSGVVQVSPLPAGGRVGASA